MGQVVQLQRCGLRLAPKPPRKSLQMGYQLPLPEERLAACCLPLVRSSATLVLAKSLHRAAMDIQQHGTDGGQGGSGSDSGSGSAQAGMGGAVATLAPDADVTADGAQSLSSSPAAGDAALPDEMPGTAPVFSDDAQAGRQASEQLTPPGPDPAAPAAPADGGEPGGRPEPSECSGPIQHDAEMMPQDDGHASSMLPTQTPPDQHSLDLAGPAALADHGQSTDGLTPRNGSEAMQHDAEMLPPGGGSDERAAVNAGADIRAHSRGSSRLDGRRHREGKWAGESRLS